MSDTLLKITPDGITVAGGTGIWLSVAQASERSGLNEGTIRRNCLSRWLPAGLARKITLPSGQSGYEVDQGADPRFGGRTDLVAIDARAQTELKKYDEKTRTSAAIRKQYVTEWDAFVGRCIAPPLCMTRDEANDRFIRHMAGKGITLTTRSLFRWRSKYRAGGVEALLDGRTAKPGETGATDFSRFNELIEDWFLRQGEPYKATCYKLAKHQAIQEGVAIPSLRHAVRHLAKIDLAKVIYHRQGPKAFDDKCAAYVARDRTKIEVIDTITGEPYVREMESNDIWVADHHPCDVIVVMGTDARGKPKLARPWLSAWLDIRSNKIVGFSWSMIEPDSSTIMLALRNAILTNGCSLPLLCYTDNGKDYDAWFWDGMTKRDRKLRIQNDQLLFAGVYASLHINHMHALPYNAKAKPIERFFRTFEDQFGRFQLTYTGNRTDRKPERLVDQLKAGHAPTFAEYTAQASRYINEVYHLTPSTAQGMVGEIPLDVYEANFKTSRTTTREALDLLLRKVSKPVKVGRNGVRFKDRDYGRANPLLAPWLGKQVLLRIDPDDERFVTVWRIDREGNDGGFICEAAAVELMPYGQMMTERSRSVGREIKAHNRAIRQLQRHNMKLSITEVDVLAEEAQRQALERAAENPKSQTPIDRVIKPIRTGLERIKVVREQQQRLLSDDSPITGLSRNDETIIEPVETDSLFRKRDRDQ